MEYVNLMEGIEFNDAHGIARPIHADENGRLLRFALLPGQAIKEHSSPSSPVYLVVLKGKGVFTGGDNARAEAEAGSIVMLEPGEKHSIQALDEELVFVAILHGSPRGD